jgi:NAD(P)-dependent dehydrogenase (short-subunit alcohol dehydrogenase family)
MAAKLKPLNEVGALVTGGTSGIGLATAAALVAAGVTRMVVNGREPGRGAAAANHLRTLNPIATIAFSAGDVSLAAGASAVCEHARATLGSVDVVINCAGGDHAPELFHDIAPEALTTMLGHYALPPMHVSRCILPHMAVAGGGVIVNVASDAGRVPTPGACLNGAAMAAIIMFSRTLALETKRSGIRVHAVAPSIVKDTRTFDRVMSGGFSAKLFAKAMNRASLGVATPDDVAAAILFLVSPAASRMTGQVISVNGGVSVPA